MGTKMFTFEPDELQKECFGHIDNNDNLLVCIPTGCGKTVIGEYAIYHNLSNSKKSIYTSPIKSLSNEKYKDFRDKYGQERVGIMTGDIQINPTADIVIMTTEILRNDLHKNKTDENLGCVIFDEVHYINDEDRGTIWEETLILLKSDIQLILLSATINNPNCFTSWLSNIKQKPMKLVLSYKRPVPLIHYTYCYDKMYKIMEKDTYKHEIYDEMVRDYKREYSISHKTDSKIHVIKKFADELEKRDLLQAIFFSFSRLQCEKYAKCIERSFISTCESSEAIHIFEHYMAPYKKTYEILEQYNTIYTIIQKGIGYHHSGLAPVLKEIVEILFKKKLIKILFATETFAVGINMPTRTVVFTELAKHTNNKYRYINPTEYRQMSGRAGRRGMDIVGTVISLFIEPIEEFDFRQILTGQLPTITSKFNINYQLLLKVYGNKSNLTELYTSSLANIDNIITQQNTKQELDKIDLELSTYETFDSKTLELIRKYDSMPVLTNVVMKLSKKQIQANKQLMNDKDFQTKYSQYKKQSELLKTKTRLENQMLSSESILSYQQNQQNKLLHIHGFLTSDFNLTLKGIMASDIDECNALLIADMIDSDVLIDLTPEEIVGTLGIFVDDKSETTFLSDIDNSNIKKVLTYINVLIQDYNKTELELDLHTNNYWDINYNNINLLYLWAKGANIKEISMYEGNFIRANIKINNIVKNMISMCEMSNNVKLIPTLMKIESLIIRDIVTTNSLYML